MLPGALGLSSVTTAGANMIALTVGVDEGVGVGVGLTGHVLGVGVGEGAKVKESSLEAGPALLCDHAVIGSTNRSARSIRQRRALKPPPNSGICDSVCNRRGTL